MKINTFSEAKQSSGKKHNTEFLDKKMYSPYYFLQLFKKKFMIARAFRFFFLYLCIACTFSLVVALTFFYWAAQNRETSALAADIPHDGYLLTTKEGQIF